MIEAHPDCGHQEVNASECSMQLAISDTIVSPPALFSYAIHRHSDHGLARVHKLGTRISLEGNIWPLKEQKPVKNPYSCRNAYKIVKASGQIKVGVGCRQLEKRKMFR